MGTRTDSSADKPEPLRQTALLRRGSAAFVMRVACSATTRLSSRSGLTWRRYSGPSGVAASRSDSSSSPSFPAWWDIGLWTSARWRSPGRRTRFARRGRCGLLVGVSRSRPSRVFRRDNGGGRRWAASSSTTAPGSRSSSVRAGASGMSRGSRVAALTSSATGRRQRSRRRTRVQQPSSRHHRARRRGRVPGHGRRGFRGRRAYRDPAGGRPVEPGRIGRTLCRSNTLSVELGGRGWWWVHSSSTRSGSRSLVSANATTCSVTSAGEGVVVGIGHVESLAPGHRVICVPSTGVEAADAVWSGVPLRRSGPSRCRYSRPNFAASPSVAPSGCSCSHASSARSPGTSRRSPPR